MKSNETSIAAHNLALVLTQASLKDIEKEQLASATNNETPNFMPLIDIAKKYSFYYDKFYTYALDQFESILNDDE